VDGVPYVSFRVVCKLLYLMKEDQEWIKDFTGAIQLAFSSSLRSMFISASLTFEILFKTHF
ncbi:MAG: hypothetical protein EXX96DRAFT_480647, partial [Benjaminiella poitrasii]